MDIVFLCGGEGTRLRPLTYAVPKPMLPIGSKPILEINISRARDLGFKRYFFMVNYKAEVISSYFRDGNSFGVEIRYFEEKERRGTAGPLYFLKNIVEESFVVMNADVLTELDLKKLLKFHKDSEAGLTVALKRVEMKIPYGVAKLGTNSNLLEMDEKPVLEYLINSGIYAVSPDIVGLIPSEGMYHMTDFIADAISQGIKVSGYTFDDSWRDIGRLDDYLEAVNDNGEDTTLGEFGSSF
ncbi:MAG: sugar phosphate nucleotidyltransferase [Candidatus Thorarchaeota archaeon]|jgi:NDP-sugar pyrophosphorylase family protein